jgi:N-acetylglutamate synthase-like GNAT family acetyltransferase
MSSSAFHIRRATIDDLPTLKAMWESMQIATPDLDKRLTEFQVAEDARGHVVGTVGFWIQGRHGLIHSEAFTDFGVADQVRPLFWRRIEALVLNHGVARLWTRENTPFWTHSGLVPADDEALQRLPEAWDRSARGWLTLRLKDEDTIASLEKEFDMFVAAERARTSAAVGSAKKVKSVLLTTLLLIFLAGLGYLAYLVITGRIGPASR